LNDSQLRERIRQHFKDRCAYCFSPQEINDAIFELEHIIPQALGGETTFENLCFACPLCNRYKSSFISGVDPETGETARLFHPHLDKWPQHFSIQADEMLVGLTPVGRATISRLKLNRPVLVRLRSVWRGLGLFPPI
jgi:5-methylcytosine-specific restriction endonuclease McrA